MSVGLAVGGSFHSYKFLPTICKYIVKVLNGVSNGDEKDSHWAWKMGFGDPEKSRGEHEKVVPHMELRDMEDARFMGSSKL